MKRKALIIGVPGDGNDKDYLTNVWVDMKNMKEFLVSNHGGEWSSNEIQIMYPNPSPATIAAEIKNIKADYSLVFYAGHGGFKKSNGLTYLWLNNQWVAENWLYSGNETKKQMIILDTCRTYIEEEKERVAKLSYTNESDLQKSLTTRLLFDEALKKCEDGLIRCYSSSENQSADDSAATGGYFTYSLLETAKLICERAEATDTFSIKQIFGLVEGAIKQFTPVQKPELNGGRRFHYFPFAAVYRSTRRTTMTF